MDQFVDALSKVAVRKRKRASEEIDDCEQQIIELQERKEKAQEMNEYWTNIADLKTLGKAAWNRLPGYKKWDKSVVLAVFASGQIPDEMKEENWDRMVPKALTDDRVVLIARMKHDGFAWHYYKNGIVFRVPDKFLRYPLVVYEAIRAFPEVLLQDNLPTEYFDDSSAFYAYIESRALRYYRPNRDVAVRSLMGKFSTRIRQDPNWMLQAAEQKADVFTHMDLSELVDDKPFASRLIECDISVPDDALGKFSKAVQGNKKVVLSFVKKNGCCLKDASSGLREDVDVVTAACFQNAKSISYCGPGPAMQKLFNDKRFMIDKIFSRIEKGNTFVWKNISTNLVKDPDVIFAAYRSDCLSMEQDLPYLVAKDPKVWMSLVQKDGEMLRFVPDALIDDTNIAHSVKEFKNFDLAKHVLGRSNVLARDPKVWKTIIGSPMWTRANRENKFLVTNVAPPDIRNSKEIMELACRRDATVLECLPQRLLRDRHCIEAAIAAENFVLSSIPAESQRLFPSIIAKYIDGYAGFSHSLVPYVDPSLWENLEVAKAWIKKTCAWVHEAFPDKLKKSREFALLIAEFCDEEETFFGYVSRALQNDKSFMAQACALNAYIYLDAAKAIRFDRDVALATFANGSSECLLEILWDRNMVHTIHFLSDYKSTIDEKLKSHKGFTKGFLFGFSDSAGPNCQIGMLVQDVDTTLGYKKLIAEYVGVPTGKELGLFRKASRHLPDFNER